MRQYSEPNLQHRITVGDIGSRCDHGGLTNNLPPLVATQGSSSASPSASASPTRLSSSDKRGVGDCCYRLATSPWWTALIIVLLLAIGAIGDLTLRASSNLHLRAATLRAAGGSALLGARCMCMLRLSEAGVVWLVLLVLRRGCRTRAPRPPLHGAVVGNSSSPPANNSSPPLLSVSGVAGSSLTNGGGSPGDGDGGEGGLKHSGSAARLVDESGRACGLLPGAACPADASGSTSSSSWVTDGWPAAAYPPDCASPPSQKEAARQDRRAGATLLCTLSGWVWVLLGVFSVLGSICSLLVAMGGRTAPGMLGDMFNHDGFLGRRSVLGRSLPALTWLSFEVRNKRTQIPSHSLLFSHTLAHLHVLAASSQVGSAGALYVACLSILMLTPHMLLFVCSKGPKSLQQRLQALQRLCAGGGAEPPLAHKLQSLFVHALALLIAFAELCLNDLPVLWQHRPLALLMGCAFSLNLLGWHAYQGRFTYLYADAPRTGAYAALIACVLTPAALVGAFACLASISAASRVRSPGG